MLDQFLPNQGVWAQTPGQSDSNEHSNEHRMVGRVRGRNEAGRKAVGRGSVVSRYKALRFHELVQKYKTASGK